VIRLLRRTRTSPIHLPTPAASSCSRRSGPPVIVRKVHCTLTGSPPDSPPSSHANVPDPPTYPSRELLQSAKRSARHSAQSPLHSDRQPARFASFVARERPRSTYLPQPRTPAIGEAV